MGIGFLSYLSRSGSTLLSRMLNEYEEICVTLEASFPPELLGINNTSLIKLQDQYELEAYIDSLFQLTKLRSWRLSKEQINNFFQNKVFPIKGTDLFKAFLTLYGQRHKSDAKLIIYKGSPIMPWESKNIIEKFPQAKILQIIRDPRAIYSSQKNNLHPYESRPYAETTVQVAEEWEKAILTSQIINSNQFKMIQYEDFISDTENCLNTIIQFLNVRGKRIESNSNFFTENIPKKERSVHQLINEIPNKDRIQRWKSSLSLTEIGTLDCLLKSYYSELGYEIISRPPNKLSILAIIISGKIKLNFRKYFKKLIRLKNGLINNRFFYLKKIIAKISKRISFNNFEN